MQIVQLLSSSSWLSILTKVKMSINIEYVNTWMYEIFYNIIGIYTYGINKLDNFWYLHAYRNIIRDTI